MSSIKLKRRSSFLLFAAFSLVSAAFAADLPANPDTSEIRGVAGMVSTTAMAFRSGTVTNGMLFKEIKVDSSYPFLTQMTADRRLARLGLNGMITRVYRNWVIRGACPAKCSENDTAMVDVSFAVWSGWNNAKGHSKDLTLRFYDKSRPVHSARVAFSDPDNSLSLCSKDIDRKITSFRIPSRAFLAMTDVIVEADRGMFEPCECLPGQCVAPPTPPG